MCDTENSSEDMDINDNLWNIDIEKLQSYECDTEDSCEAGVTENISHEHNLDFGEDEDDNCFGQSYGFSEENVPVFKSNFQADVLFEVIKYFYSII